MAGIFDPDMVGALSNIPQMDPKLMGVLAAAGAGLQASGPSRMPVSTGQVLGNALTAGLGGYAHGVQGQRQGILMAAQLSELAKKQEQQKRINDYAASLPEKDRAAFLVDPAGFLKNQNASPFGKVNPNDYTPESISIFNATRDFSKLVPVRKHEAITTAGPNGPQTEFINPYAPPQAPVAQPVKNEMTPAGQLFNPYTTPQSEIVPDPNKPFGLTQTPGGVGLKPTANLPYQTFSKERAKAGATTVNTDSLGLKPKDRFDMEGKLRDDFRGNPTVKAASEMDSAFKLIETAKNNPSPANDLAMATKYMKVLDPGSVVRESELALAVGAVGLLDKVQNYAQMVTSGEKLTPTQREDFYNSAKAINDTFQKAKGEIAADFSKNASQYNLSPENVTGGAITSTPMTALPPAAKHRGRTIRDTTTGKLMKSDGMSWRPL